MIKIPSILQSEFNIKDWQVENALALKSEGATIPFIARYRKERTGELDENVLRDMFDRYDYFIELEDRKKTVLSTIESLDKLTPELKDKIENCTDKTELEDLYLPYKPKRRTRAMQARERGLEPLAVFIRSLNTPHPDAEGDISSEAEKYISAEKEVNSADEALAGAADIIAEEIAETADYRAWVREFILQNGIFVSDVKEEFPVGSTKYEMYRKFEVPIKDIKSHTMLALRRGESEDVLTLDAKYPEEKILEYLEKKNIHTSSGQIVDFFKELIKDAFARLMKTSITGEVRLAKKQISDIDSIDVFEQNLRQILLESPAGMKNTLGIDPGFRTGCKVAVVDDTGKFIQYKNIFPFASARERLDAKNSIKELIKKNNIELIAIGNGTAGRETDEFMNEVFDECDIRPIKVLVNESGASIYSAGTVANEEFPDLDLTVRGAISIARRLQDPLAELVKIDAKSIGVGQYQHDVDQKLLKKKLDETVESCVNYVGVNLNTASKELLLHVSGINETVAKSIVKYRNENGAFHSRKELMKIPRFGEKKFEQSAGFLRIAGGDELLDNTAVHPESYPIAKKILADLGVKADELSKAKVDFDKLNLHKFITDKTGLPTIKDIVSELKKPGRDPREEFKYAEFNKDVKEISDLYPEMELEGVVTNITNFGAFVDIGVHQDGLVHISEMADRFISSPLEVVKVGQRVKVRVKELNVALKRISLSMKSRNTATQKKNNKHGKQYKADSSVKAFTLNDLKAKFNG